MSDRVLITPSLCPEMFCEKDVLKNFAKFTGKHLRKCFFFDKVADLRPVTLLKKRPWHRYFPVNFAKCFSSTPPVAASINYTLQG